MAFILILCHCIVVLFELCIDNNQIQIFFFFFQGDLNTKQKKIVQKPSYNQAGCIVEPYNAKFQFCQKVGNGRHVYVRARGPAPHVARGQKQHGFPVQTYGETSKGRNFNCKV